MSGPAIATPKHRDISESYLASKVMREVCVQGQSCQFLVVAQPMSVPDIASQTSHSECAARKYKRLPAELRASREPNLPTASQSLRLLARPGRRRTCLSFEVGQNVYPQIGCKMPPVQNTECGFLCLISRHRTLRVCYLPLLDCIPVPWTGKPPRQCRAS